MAATPATTCSDDASDDCTVAYRALVLEDGPHGEAPVAVFDSSTDHSIIAIGVWGTSMVARVLYAPTATTARNIESTSAASSSPLTLLRGLSAYTGRMMPLPAWVDEGVVVGLEGGRETVINSTSTLQAAGVPIAAVWIQDWTGVRHTGLTGDRLWWNWESDDDEYPGWDQMVCELRRQNGVRVLSYLNPFLVNASAKGSSSGSSSARRNLLQEASDAGFLVQRPTGGNYMLKSGSFQFGTVDLSSEAATAWFTKVIVDNMLLPSSRNATAEACGVSGWMHDFGEVRLPLS